MTALGVDISSFEQETVGHGLPSGRSNLRGQQASSQRILAQDNRDAALNDYIKAGDEYEDGHTDIETLLAFRRLYDLAEAWYLYIIASESYAKSVSMLIDGEIDAATQAGIFNNMIVAGTTFRRM
jgi:hypothetical protein